MALEATNRIVETRGPLSEDFSGRVSGSKSPGPPAPSDGLATLLHASTPPNALALSTPLVRVPLTAPPEFPHERLEEHLEEAAHIWNDGWDLKEESRTHKIGALDLDRATPGHRYLEHVHATPWLSLALQDAGVTDWCERLYLLDGWTRRLDDAPDLAPPQSMPGHSTEQVLTTARRAYLAVLLDLGAAGTDPIDFANGGALPEDEHRRPSRLIAAGALIGLGRKGPLSTTVVRRAAEGGRHVLAAVGAWPWAHFDPLVFRREQLPPSWWEHPDTIRPLREWLARALEAARWSQQARQSAASRLLG